MESKQLLETLFKQRSSCRDYLSVPVEKESLLGVLRGGQGVRSARGERMTPSAHALYPLSLFVLVRRVEGLAAGVYEYVPESDTLSPSSVRAGPGKLVSVSLADDVWLDEAPVVVVIAANMRLALKHFRDQQADGKRGRRYVAFEAGAVAQNMSLSACVHGLAGVVVMGFDDQALARYMPLASGMEAVAMFCLGVPA